MAPMSAQPTSTFQLRRPPPPHAPDRGTVGSGTARSLRRDAREFRDPIECWVIELDVITLIAHHCLCQVDLAPGRRHLSNRKGWPPSPSRAHSTNAIAAGESVRPARVTNVTGCVTSKAYAAAAAVQPERPVHCRSNPSFSRQSAIKLESLGFPQSQFLEVGMLGVEQ